MGGAGVGHLGSAGGDTGFPPWWLFALFAAIIALPWAAVMSVYLWKGTVARGALSATSAPGDDLDPEAISQRARHPFRCIQDDWAERQMHPSRALMSARLADELGTKIAAMREHGRVNVMKDLTLRDAIVIGARIGVAGEVDRVWMWFEGKLVDYVIDEDTELLVDGNPNGPRTLREVWSLVWIDGAWVADEIDQRPNLLRVAVLPETVRAHAGMSNKRIERTPRALS